MTKQATKRCAVYTRKSSEEGLEQDFNSLQAQRESCEAFIKSQQSEGWKLIHTAYDDGGISGGTMDRPALQRLLADISAGKIDVIVVYKVDRLTRSLADFAKMVEVFDANGVSFVAVTQQFNTTTSMGRLTLNVLLSFAQFEREVTGERIRDKIAASKAKGIWMGGYVPLGYDARDRKLWVNAEEAEIVRTIFSIYDRLGSVRALMKELAKLDIRQRPRTRTNSGTKPGAMFSKGGIYRILSNPIYVGEIRHKDITHAGQHEAIVDRALWDSVQAKLKDKDLRPAGQPRKTAPSLLMGKLFEESGACLRPTANCKNRTRRYRYYCSPSVMEGEAELNQGWRLPANEIEQLVANTVRTALMDQPALANALQEVDLQTNLLKAALKEAQQLAKGPDEATFLELMIRMAERVDLRGDGVTVSMKVTLQEKQIALTRTVKMQMKRRGSELRLIVEGSQKKAQGDPALIRVIGRAHRWVDMIVAGKTVMDIVREEGMTAPGYVRRALPLAFLSPAIVQAILDGSHDPGVTAEQLLRAGPLALQWRGQRLATGAA